MQTVGTILKSKIQISTVQKYSFLPFILIIYGQQITVINRKKQRSFQHTTMLPGIKDTRRQRNIVHENDTWAIVSKDLLVKPPDKEYTNKTVHPFTGDTIPYGGILSTDSQ